MKTNKHILRFLASALLIIWGLIVYQVVSAIYFDDSEEYGGAEIQMKKSDKNAEQFVYNQNVRDPFNYHSSKPETPEHARVAKPVTQNWNPPHFNLKGIIQTRSGKMAILEDGSGEAYFLQRGDTMQGVRILAIDSHRVQYVFEKKKSDWRLE